MNEPIKKPHFQILHQDDIHPLGWMRENFQRDATGITGNLDRLSPEVSSHIFSTGRVDDWHHAERSSWWNGESEGNWADSFIRLAFVLADKDMMSRARAWLDEQVASQEPDGYLGVYRAGHRDHYSGSRSGELWTQSRVLNSLLTGYQCTGNQTYLNACHRMAQRLLTVTASADCPASFFETPDEDGGKAHGLMIIESLLMLHRVTGQEKLVSYCEWLYEDYSSHASRFPADDCRLPNLLDPSIPFVGHGPHTCELLRIPLILYYRTGKSVYWRAFQGGMVKLKQNLSLSGTCKSDEMIGILPADGGTDLVGSRPLPSAGYEYCSTEELSRTLQTALTLTGDLQYADMAEWLAYNAAQAPRHPDGKAIQYLCADNLYAATRAMGTRWDYSPTHDDAAVCCAPNSGKILPGFLLLSWLRDARSNAPAVVMYAPSEVEFTTPGSRVVITEETRYPFEGSVRFHFSLDEPSRFPLKLRIPRWAEGFHLKVNGCEVKASFQSGPRGRMAVVERTWHKDDELRLVMDFQPQVLPAVDGTAALRYGPLLYSLRIPEQANHTRSYPLEGFHDTDYTPVPGAQWDYTLQLASEGTPGRYVRPVERPSSNGAYEWEQPPLALQTEMLDAWARPVKVDLLPLGCTRLRRTTFPHVPGADGHGD